MSSATSTSAAHGRSARRTATSGGPDPAHPAPPEAGFRVGHFFLLFALVASTVAVLMARQSTPENLVLLSLTIGAAGAAAFGLYRTLAPLVVRDSDVDAEPLTERARIGLEREKSLVLRSIKELEFDRAMGKLSAGDFDEMAGRLRARAIALMKQLDEGDSAYRAVIERELSVRLSKRMRSGSAELKLRAQTPDTAEAGGVALERREADHVCPSCLTANDDDAAFCKSCGRPLEAGVP